MAYADAQIAKILKLMEERPWDVQRISMRLLKGAGSANHCRWSFTGGGLQPPDGC